MAMTDIIRLRIDPATKVQMQDQARTAGLPLSEYIRQTALAGLSPSVHEQESTSDEQLSQ